jgi:hypothetical protein
LTHSSSEAKTIIDEIEVLASGSEGLPPSEALKSVEKHTIFGIRLLKLPVDCVVEGLWDNGKVTLLHSAFCLEICCLSSGTIWKSLLRRTRFLTIKFLPSKSACQGSALISCSGSYRLRRRAECCWLGYFRSSKDNSSTSANFYTKKRERSM